MIEEGYSQTGASETIGPIPKRYIASHINQFWNNGSPKVNKAQPFEEPF